MTVKSKKKVVKSPYFVGATIKNKKGLKRTIKRIASGVVHYSVKSGKKDFNSKCTLHSFKHWAVRND